MTRFPYLQRLTVRLALAALLLVALLAGLRPPLARAANITVNTASDSSTPGDGWCSLREAIINANNNNQSGSSDCPAGTGADDSITFSGNYTITLGSQLPAVTSVITITGNGVANTIVQASTCNPVTESCSHNYRVFEIDSSGDLTLAGLTVRHGNVLSFADGGGIYNYGTLTINNSTLSGNSTAAYGGGIANYGTATVTNSTLSGNSTADYHGGGIENAGAVTLNNSTLSGNSAATFGGGISNWNGGTVTVNNSTLSGNSAVTLGGGIWNYSGTVTISNSTFSGNSAGHSGGGIDNSDAMTVTNSTFSGNLATFDGGGIDNYDGTLTVNNSTLSGNSAFYGGGISNNGGTLTISNSLIANSSVGVDCVNDSTIATNINNLIEDGTCSPALSGDPLLSPLGSYSGSTPTFALLPGSPAIDAGDSTTCAAAPINNLDQRGIARTFGTSCDIGAFESRGFSLGSLTGTPQSTTINTTFATPLGLGVSSSFGEPVGPGGQVTLIAPGSGASVTFAPSTIASTDINGKVSQPTTANGIAGSYTVTAASRGASGSPSFSLTNLPFTPFVVVSSSANPAVVGQSVTFTAAVSGNGSPVSGEVGFVIDGGAPISVTLAGGQASLTTSSLALGNHSIAANYSGDGNHTSSSNTLAGGQTVGARLVYLPLVLNNFVSAPDLVVDSLSATGSQVTVTISNQGNAPVVDDFWVDVYLNPTTTPTGVNQPWPALGSQGLVWGVEGAALPLAPGQSLTLTIGDSYYWPDLSSFNTPLPADSPVYAQVDSANDQTTYGGVLESHEISGGVYNNITGPVLSLTGGVGLALPASGSFAPAASSSLPPRD